MEVNDEACEGKISSKFNESEKDRIRFGETDIGNSEIYDQVQSQFDRFETLIVTTDVVKEGYGGVVATGSSQIFSARAGILNEVAQGECCGK